MRHENPNRDTATLVSDTLNAVTSLVRGEVDLARAEISENLNKAGVAIGLIVGAVVVALVALHVLAAALVAGLTEAGMDAGWAALLVGLVFGGIAAGMMMKGLSDLQLSSLAPTRTARNVQRDAYAAKEAYNGE
ncbi:MULTISPECIES: phage holin family protein [unclassified Marinovum]